MDRNFLVVGGGISGIATAHYLKQSGHDVILLESADFLGGRMACGTIAGETLDLGGKNIGHHYDRFRELAAHYGVTEYQDSGINTSRVINGKIIQLDGSRRLQSLVKLLGPAGAVAALRLLPYVLRVVRNDPDGFLSSPYFSAIAAKRDDQPLTRYFSKTVCDRLIRSMVVISNGAEPDESYAGNLGTNLHSLFDTYEQLTQGMGPLLQKFRASADVRLQTRAIALHTSDGRVEAVRVASGDKQETLPCTDVVLALPASATASLLDPVLPDVSGMLREIRYFPVAVAVARYSRPVFKPEHRALMFDASTIASNAAAYARDRLDIVRYTFSGRQARPYIRQISESSPADAAALQAKLLSLAESELGRHFQVSPGIRVAEGWRTFHAGLCAYGPHQARRVAGIRQAVTRLRGLHVTGDYAEGASIEACCRAARATVSAALS